MKIAEFSCVIVLLLWFLCCVTSQPIGCNPGWFGRYCRYKCRCASSDCDQVSGQCPGTCQGGWFGPACQYADLAYNKSQTPQLTDGLDSTCNTNKMRSETVTFDMPYFFTWLRVHFNSPDALKQNLTLTFNTSNTRCDYQETATVDERTLDIYCYLYRRVTSVTLTGDGVPPLCSIYVSGGRNIAINEQAEQSTTLYDNSSYYTAERSVDGNVNPDFYQGQSCSSTAPGQSTPGTWQVRFSQPRLINRYVIYNRKTFSYRMVGFTLQSFDNANHLLFNYTNRQDDLSVYTVTHAGLYISLVKITSGSADNLLHMCEVEVYGDSSCDPHRYGRECENTCNCAWEFAYCLTSTGGCPSGCRAGFNGENCLTLCEPGTFGPGCLGKCEFCTNDTHGAPSCDRASGVCLIGCDPGYQGSLCNASCDRGSYGRNCAFNCSDLCVDTNDTDESPCNHVTGVCTIGCQGGFDQRICPQETKTTASDNGQRAGIIAGCIVGAVILAAILAAVIIFYRRQRKKTPQTNDNNIAALSRRANTALDDDASRRKTRDTDSVYELQVAPEVLAQETGRRRHEDQFEYNETYENPVEEENPYDEVSEKPDGIQSTLDHHPYVNAVR